MKRCDHDPTTLIHVLGCDDKPRRPGRPPLGAAKRVRVVAHLSPPEFAALAALAASEGVTPGALAARLLGQAVKR